MSFNFESKNKSIEETLFGINSLRVPQFQRPYTWEEDQCSDFWNDLTDDDSFFLGQFILNYENKEKEGFIDIVDGQQRTTSILILCAVFRDKIKELGYHEDADVVQHNVMLGKKSFSGPVYKVLVSPTITNFFERYVQSGTEIIKSDTKHDSDEEKRVVKNYLFFKNQLDDYLKSATTASAQVELIKSIYNFLLKTQIIVTGIYDENDAYEIFESVNNTGIELGVADLLKNFLFKKIKIEEGGSVSDIMEKWSEILENVPGTELTKFIRYYWLSKQREFITEAKLFKAIKNHQEIQTGKQFLQELLDNAKIYYDLRNPLDADFSNIDHAEKVKNSLIGIREMNITQCYVLLLSIYRNRDKINTGWVRIFQLIEKFNFVYHAMSKLPANKVEKLYQEVAYKIEHVVNNEKNETALRIALETEFNNLSNKLKSLLPPKEIFVLGFMDLSYKKKGLCRYVLSKIEESYGSDAQEFLLNQANLTIEHILPQKPGKEWNLTQSQIKNYVHNVGNLTLLGKKPNGAVGNKSIDEKIKILKESTEIKMTQKLMSDIELSGIWNEESIKLRSSELANLAFDKVWKI
jgi:uncharacterized protein with ParB-like and HNH nuclease domain